MKIEGKKTLVTGAGGFIGSHLVETLVRMGAKVRVFVRYNSRGSAITPEVTWDFWRDYQERSNRK